MKRTYYILLVLLLFFVGCQNDDWKDEIDSIKKELTVQAQLIEQIQKGVYIKSVYKTENGYTIAFSDDREIELTDGQAPLITIGSNGNWYIDGVDTGNSSKGKDGSNGNDGSDGNSSEAPIITIGANGNWFIDGVDTEKPSQGMNGTDGKDAATIVSIVKTQSSFVFNFSDGSSLNAPFESEQEVLQIIGWGDSLTAGTGGDGVTYLITLQSLLGKSYQVINCGVSAETPATIASRQGGVPAFITTAFTLPANQSPIEISSTTNYRLKNLLYNTITAPLRSGGGNSVNPCYINGIECTMRYISSDAVWTIQRNQASSTSTLIPANTPAFYYGARAYKNSYAMCIWMGQNGGYTTNEQLIDYHKRMIEYNGNSNYIIIGLHTGTATSRATLETAMLKEFGLTYINWREYISSREAFYDANLTPTQADLTAIAEGSLPPTFWASSTDKVHLNATGYTLLGKLVYKRFQMLGIV